MQTYVVDIDDTLLKSKKEFCDCCGRVKYTLFCVYENEIKKVNELYKKGNTIVLWTGRNWDCYDMTKQQLKKAGIKYHELVMGKPQGVYVDADALLTLEGEE
jgi:hydroxymethylpyrimidine pyrophosphatase-like HAD family hydrolase